MDAIERSRAVETRVSEVAAPALSALGLELVAVQYRGEAGGKVLRIFVDRPGGVTLADCAAASRHLGDLLDVYLPAEDAYNLEVSSPGADRPLVTEEHFNRFAGSAAQVRTREKIDGRANFTGTIIGAEDGIVTLDCDNQPTAIPMSAILRAKLRPRYGEDPC